MIFIETKAALFAALHGVAERGSKRRLAGLDGYLIHSLVHLRGANLIINWIMSQDKTWKTLGSYRLQWKTVKKLHDAFWRQILKEVMRHTSDCFLSAPPPHVFIYLSWIKNGLAAFFFPQWIWQRRHWMLTVSDIQKKSFSSNILSKMHLSTKFKFYQSFTVFTFCLTKERKESVEQKFL